MKRNETVLVYGVTGLLVVILLVAVVFGNDGSTSQPGPGGTNPANKSGEKTVLSDLIKEPVVDEKGKLAKSDLTPSGDKPTTETPAAPGTGAALKLDDPAAKKAPVLDPDGAFLLRSEREGEYRKVVVQDGESFSLLLERFGIEQSRRDEVMRLNEHLSNQAYLRAGEPLILPWVADEKLLAAAKERKARGLTDRPTEKRPEPGLALAATREHKVKKGESLWKLATTVGGGSVTQAMERIKELNPSVNFDVLPEGVLVKLPAK